MGAPAQILFRTRDFALGEFRCPPHDPRWHTVNVMSGAPHVVFPGTTVGIQQAGHEPVVTTRNHVVYYSRNQPYRRILRDPRGDHCAFVAVSPELLATLWEHAGVRSPTDGAMPFASGPSDATAYLSVYSAVHALRDRASDELHVEELVYDALRRVVRAARSLQLQPRPARRLRTAREHRRLAEDAKALVSDRLAEHDSLEELARMLHTSPFHLARVFRAHTGFPLHRYRTQLRLRLALEQVLAGSAPLSDIARAVGFTHHSQFTTAFNRAFGVAPSRLTARAAPARA
jgi:AraC family transcriptional regulator